MTGVAELLWTLRERCGVDLRDYRADGLDGGLRRRMAETASADVAAYVARLGQDADEAERLLEAVLVQATSFFRDEAVFDALRDVVAPALRRGSGPLRAWVIGCATGEEAWSLASVLHDVCGPAFSVLATDLSAAAVARAREGSYPGRSIPDALRARVTFARHDITGPRLAPSEAIVARFDLVLLRNVLIYFRTSLQERVIHRVAGVLPAGGALVLGPVERVPRSDARRFDPWPGLDEGARVYRRIGETT